MKIYNLLFLSCLFVNCASTAQNNITPKEMSETAIPYKQIPEYPEKMTAGTSIGRILDGLGYRYYWATEELREVDRNYEPGNDGQSAKSVLKHLHGLSLMIYKSAKKEPNIRPAPALNMTWEEQRVATLNNIKMASDIFKASSDKEIEDFSIIFQRGEKQNSVPVWHLFNGPIDDAIYHVGQIVSYRRTTGNPMNPFVNVFMGKNRDQN